MIQKKHRGELILLALLVALSLGCIFFSKTGSEALGMQNEHLTPNQYSNIFGVLLIAACAVRLLALFREARAASAPPDAPAQPHAAARRQSLTVGFMMLFAVLYVFGIRYIGFYLTTAVCLFVVNMTFEGWNKRHIGKAAAFSLGVCAVTLVVFRYLKVFLPKALFF